MERHPRPNALTIRRCPRNAKSCAGRRRAQGVTHGFWLIKTLWTPR
jgi:hypothetical protein